MPRVITNTDDYEQWKSAIPGLIEIKRLDGRSGEIRSEMVAGGKTVYLLPEERRMNQEIAASNDLDPFLNGMMVPLKLVESAADFEALQGNANHLTEQDMRKLLVNPKKAGELRSAISGVTNVVTLQRLLAIAEDPDNDCTLRQVSMIRERISQCVSEDADVIEVQQVMSSDGRPVLGTHAPDSPEAPANPSAGRREARRQFI